MDAFLPAVTKFLLHASPGKFQPGFIEKGGKLVFTRHPDQDGRRISHGLKTASRFQLTKRSARRRFTRLASKPVISSACRMTDRKTGYDPRPVTLPNRRLAKQDRAS